MTLDPSMIGALCWGAGGEGGLREPWEDTDRNAECGSALFVDSVEFDRTVANWVFTKGWVEG